VVKTRYKPAASTEAFAGAAAGASRTAVSVASEDLATVLVRFDNGARGCVTVGQVCAGHKNDLWLEVNGSHSSLRWHQERQNELWLGRRDGPNGILPKDPTLLAPAARPYARLPGGHQEAWSDAFRNVLQDVYMYIAQGGHRSAETSPTFPTFEDGYRGACIVDAILESHRRGGVWTPVAPEVVADAR